MGRLTENDKAAYMNNREDRLDFEISNMVKTNHKLVQGRISQYFPILHRDAAPYDPCRSFVSPSLVCEKLNRILEIDFSLFHRELNYLNAEKGIEKELVMRKVMPDIILMPVYGTRSMMWQEISGRVRSSPGRFILPVFTDENLDEMFVRLAGNFRWELCRTMMGTAWNDITQSSLTSEYADYIQFYRKNRDLTEEAKEKVKALIAKHHNRLREIFTSEYEIWINNESNGNPRLNRVARSIFIKHCPFSRPIRSGWKSSRSIRTCCTSSTSSVPGRQRNWKTGTRLIYGRTAHWTRYCRKTWISTGSCDRVHLARGIMLAKLAFCLDR